MSSISASSAATTAPTVLGDENDVAQVAWKEPQLLSLIELVRKHKGHYAHKVNNMTNGQRFDLIAATLQVSKPFHGFGALTGASVKKRWDRLKKEALNFAGVNNEGRNLSGLAENAVYALTVKLVSEVEESTLEKKKLTAKEKAREEEMMKREREQMVAQSIPFSVNPVTMKLEESSSSKVSKNTKSSKTSAIPLSLLSTSSSPGSALTESPDKDSPDKETTSKGLKGSSSSLVLDLTGLDDCEVVKGLQESREQKKIADQEAKDFRELTNSRYYSDKQESKQRHEDVTSLLKQKSALSPTSWQVTSLKPRSRWNWSRFPSMLIFLLILSNWNKKRKQWNKLFQERGVG